MNALPPTRALAPCLITVITALPAGATAQAETDETPPHARIEAELKKRATRTDETCGTRLDVTLDFASFPAKKREKYSLASYCSEPLRKLRELCRGPATKKYVARRVRTYRCRHAQKDGRRLTVEKGVLTLEVDFEAKNNGRFARRELVRKL